MSRGAEKQNFPSTYSHQKIFRFNVLVDGFFSAKYCEAAKDEIDWEKRDHIGIYKQKQLGLNYVGLHIPVRRLYAEDMFEIARLAEVYGSGEIRFTVEQNIIIPIFLIHV